MLSLRGGLATLTAVLTTAACTINVNAEPYVTTEQKTFAVSGTPDVTLRTFDGSIQVTGWDKPEVAVTIERRAGSEAEAKQLEVKTSQDGDRILVEAVQPERGIQVGIDIEPSVRFVVSVPRQTNLVARSGDGAIDATDVRGRIELRSGDGSVKGAGLDGDILVNTGDGAITLEDASGKVNLTTGDGSVRVHGAPTMVKVDTGDGSVALDLTSNASIVEDWEITTGDGSVRVALPPTVNATLEASTGDGSISAADFGLQTSADSRQELRGPIGSGGPMLRVRTGDGSITVAKN